MNNSSHTSRCQIKMAVNLHVYTSFINTQSIERALKYEEEKNYIQCSRSQTVIPCMVTASTLTQKAAWVPESVTTTLCMPRRLDVEFVCLEID